MIGSNTKFKSLKLQWIEDKIKINIFIYVDFPLNLTLTCRNWSVIAKNPDVKAVWLIAHYGKAHALFHAVRLGPVFIDIPVCQALIKRKVILSRYFIQRLLMNFGQYDQKLIKFKLEHNVTLNDGERFHQKLWASNLPTVVFTHLLMEGYNQLGEASQGDDMELFRSSIINYEDLTDLILNKRFIPFPPRPKALQLGLNCDLHIHQQPGPEEYPFNDGYENNHQLNLIARAILIYPDLVNLWRQIGYYEICDNVNDLVMQGAFLILFPPRPESDWSCPSVDTVISRLAELRDLGFNLKDNVIINILCMIEHRLDKIGNILWSAFLSVRSGESMLSLALKLFEEAFKPERNLKKVDLLNFLITKFNFTGLVEHIDAQLQLEFFNKAQYNLGKCYYLGNGFVKDEVKTFEWYNDAQNGLGFFYESGICTNKDLKKAFELYKKSAENGNKFAQYNLGNCFTFGIGIEKDDVKAFEWYKKSAEQGHGDAQNRLGFFYKNGIGTNKDLEKAFEWYKKSAEQEHSDSQNMLGFFYENGIGTNIDLEKAFEWYKKSPKQEHNDSRFFCENGICTNIDLEKAFEWYKKLAEQECSDAQNRLGFFYENSIGTNKDLEKAFEWYEKSAKQEHIDSQNRLGFFYENGIGTSKNLEKAFEWFQKAAENGNKIAQYNLGNCFTFVIGIEKDEVMAFEWYKKSAEQECSDSQNRVGFFYENGIGTNKDLEKAFVWYKKAAENGNKFAQYNLGNCFKFGIGIEKDDVKAFEWYKKSAEQEYSNAQYQLGQCYKYEIGAEKDEVKAFEWYKKSAEQEDSDAQNKVGYFYNNGVGIEKDLEKAVCWYQKAAENGNKCEQYNLGVCYEDEKGIEKEQIKAFEWYKNSAEQEHSDGIGTTNDLEWYKNSEHSDAQNMLGFFYENGIGINKDLGKVFEKEYNDAQNKLRFFYDNGIGTNNDLGKAFEWYKKAAENNNLGRCDQLKQDNKLETLIEETNNNEELNNIQRKTFSKSKTEWIEFSQFSNLEKIAEGGYSIIYKATWLEKGTVAIKRFKDSRNFKDLFNELKSIYQCYDDKFEYIIRCYGITKDPITKDLMLIMKYVNGGNLHDYLRANFTNITWEKKLYILWRISDGLQTIHEKNFIHRDFHSGNILIESNRIWNVDKYLIGDLGLSQSANSNNEIYGVVPYIAPEIFNGVAFSKESDIYSMSMIMWELTIGCKPFDNVNHDTDLIISIINGERPKITDDTPECFADLVKRCWNSDPTKRPSAKKICETFYLWWSNIKKDASQIDQVEDIQLELIKSNMNQFNQAEDIRLELIKSNILGPEFNNKIHPDAIYISRPLSSLISKSSSSINNYLPQEYISKEMDFDINI